MTNKELQELFRQITTTNNNIFDIYMALDVIKDKYKTSDFYKTTKLSILKAYEFYMQTIGNIEYLIGLFRNVTDKELIDILDVITKNLSIESLIDTMDDNNKKLFMELLPFIPR